MGQERGNVVRRVDHGSVAEGGEHGGVGEGHEPHRDGQDEDEGALASGEHGGQVASPLGGEVFEGVAGDLALEAAQLGANGGEVRVDEGRQAGHAAQARVVRGRGGETPPAPVDALQGDDVVGGASPGRGVGAASVVGDHPADGGPVLRGGVGSEAQAVGGGSRLEGRANAPRFDGGGACVGIDV